MKPMKRIGILPPAMLCLVSGCAGSAPAHVTPAGEARPTREVRIDERVTAVETRMNEMNQRLDKVGGQVQTLEGGVAGAQSRAQEASRKAEGVDQRLTRLWSNRFNQQTADSLEVYFSPDSINLSDAAQTALAGVVKELQSNPSITVELGGYTDPHGSLDYNYALSQRRVDAVRRFLIDKGIQLARIQAASLGPLGGTDIPDTKKRRVTVRLMVDRE
ncbi:MAG: OmpA family protein [Candidatus Rokuibacteriota bacterium]